MWANLDEFTQWYKASGYPIRPPAKDPIYVTDHTYSAIVYREGRYQAEMYMLAPNWETPQHGHPGVDARIIYLNGTLSGSCNGERLLDSTPVCEMTKEDGTNIYMGAEHPFNGTDVHSVWAGHKGALVIITQHWAEGLEMTSQSVHYEGEPLGPVHAPNVKPQQWQPQ
jgi:hypothetical protein